MELVTNTSEWYKNEHKLVAIQYYDLESVRQGPPAIQRLYFTGATRHSPPSLAWRRWTCANSSHSFSSCLSPKPSGLCSDHSVIKCQCMYNSCVRVFMEYITLILYTHLPYISHSSLQSYRLFITL
jgi:hypothetical protein